jgi:acetyltransferase
VVRAETSLEMFDWARALAWCPPPRGRSVAVLTNAGGPGVTAADALELSDLQLAALSEETHSGLAALLPPAASLNNPVDMLASASPEQYAACLRLLLQDQGVDSVLVILPPPPMYTAGAVAKALIPVIHAADKPVVVALMGERLIQEAVEHFRAARVPEYRFPERAASALGVLAARSDYLAQVEKGDLLDPPEMSGIDQGLAEAILSEGLPVSRERLLPAGQAARLLQAYGIRTLQTELVHNASEAAALAEKLGFPVALKIASPDIPHKSDVGGILLNLPDAGQVEEGFKSMLENVGLANPQARLTGATVQHMAPSGQDVIVGVVRDEQFGPLAMFGSGGVEVEGLKDIRFGLAPLTFQEADEMLEKTWAGRKLHGYRSLPPADRPAALQALLRIARLAADFPQIAEVEVNPLRVLPAGQGVYALDIRVILKV